MRTIRHPLAPSGRKPGWVALYVFSMGNNVLRVAEEAYTHFTSESVPTMPALLQMEERIVAMTLDLFHGGDSAVGHLTSGGAESIFLALKAARDRVRDPCPHIGQPGVVVPDSAHPAFDQAAHDLELRMTRVPLRADLRADATAMAAAITPQTMMLVGSAPCFPYGLIDPIAELSDLAQAHDLWLHVDASVGGFVAPFARRLGHTIPDFDFTLSGVWSISADLHQYGFAAKGASTLLYRGEDLRQPPPVPYAHGDHGVLIPSMFADTQPGGATAAAWAIMHYLGVEGYQVMAQTIIQACDALTEGIRAIEGIHILAEPDLGILAYGAHALDIHAVVQSLREAGWFVVQPQQPQELHLMLMPAHAPIVERYLHDLAAAVAQAQQGPTSAIDADTHDP